MKKCDNIDPTGEADEQSGALDRKLRAKLLERESQQGQTRAENVRRFSVNATNVATKSTHLPFGMPAVSVDRAVGWNSRGRNAAPEMGILPFVYPGFGFPSFPPFFSPESARNRKNNDQYLRSTLASVTRWYLYNLPIRVPLHLFIRRGSV